MRLSNRQSHRARNDGSAVVVMIALLGLMLVFVGANLKTLHFLKREIKLIDTRQVHRLERQHPAIASSGTNEISVPQRVPAGQPTAPTTR